MRIYGQVNGVRYADAPPPVPAAAAPDPAPEPARAPHAGQTMEAARAAKRTRTRPPCGTEAAYGRHRRAGEDVCEQCHQAFLEARRRRRAQKRGRKLSV